MPTPGFALGTSVPTKYSGRHKRLTKGPKAVPLQPIEVEIQIQQNLRSIADAGETGALYSSLGQPIDFSALATYEVHRLFAIGSVVWRSRSNTLHSVFSCVSVMKADIWVITVSLVPLPHPSI